MRFRIAQVCADRGIAPGGTKGASLHLRGIAAGLHQNGHEVTTYARRSAEGAFPVDVRPLEAFAIAGPIDLVYERYSLGHLDGMHEARRRGVPFVLEVNAPLIDEASRHRPETVNKGDLAIEEQLLAEADLVIVVSSALQKWAANHRNGPTVMLSNGFEPAWFRGPESTPRFDLAFIGHPKPWHGADRIPSLLASLQATGHRPSAVVIGGGDAATALLEDAQRLGVSDCLEVTGPLPPPDAARWLRTARIGLAPYRRIEPFYFCPLKVVDYLAAGLAVVASNIGDISTLTRDAGLLVDPDDDQALVDSVAALLDDPAQLADRAEAGREISRAQTWTAVASRTIDAVESLDGHRL